jgi:aspartyl-tRNA(Asn)/glutamyl-tRNA(Gln) amidotransferase subunit C
MQIDVAEVLRIAALARLQIRPEEAPRLAESLERIVAHIDSLRDVPLPPDAESLTYFGSDVHREDRAVGGLTREEALSNAPEADGEFFLVPKVLERDAE